MRYEPNPPIKIEVENPATPGYPEGGAGLNVLVSNFIGAATMVAGILLVSYLVFGGVSYIVAGGDEKALAKAKNMMTNAAIGLLIVVLATTVAAIVGKVLGIPILTPPWSILVPRVEP